MSYWLFDFIFTLNRWVHIVAATTMMGGILFFNLVLPLATADLRDEQQLAVLGRARWIFRRVVWWSAILLLISGGLSFLRIWPIYRQERVAVAGYWLTSIPWSMGHAVLGVLAFGLAFRATASVRMARRPQGWFAATMISLFAVVFLACAARQMELNMGRWSRDGSVPYPDRRSWSGGSSQPINLLRRREPGERSSRPYARRGIAFENVLRRYSMLRRAMVSGSGE